MEASKPQLNSLSQKFLAELEQFVPSGGFRIEFADAFVARIPARDAQVGDLKVWLEDEITVEVGELHHCHFPVEAQTGLTLEEREQATAASAANYVRDILSDRICFQVQLSAGSICLSTSWKTELSKNPKPHHLLSSADEIREYVWSGRVP